MHIGKQNNICPKLKVHEEIMKVTESETYLGNIISNTAKIKEYIQARSDN